MATHHIGRFLLTTYIVPLIIVSIIAVKIYNGLQNPLRKLPGPGHSLWTRLPLKYAILQGERVRYVHSLHERYGPIVRIAPDEVSIADVDAAKILYRVGGSFRKSEWYNVFTGSLRHRSLFTMVDPKQHGAHRRLTAFNFSEKWVANLEPFIAKNVKLAIDRMAEEERMNGFVDVFKWYMFMATDVIAGSPTHVLWCVLQHEPEADSFPRLQQGEASFGSSFDMLKTGKKNQYSEDLEMIGSRSTIRAEFPLFAKLMSYSPIGSAKEINRAVQRMRHYADQSIQRYWRQLEADPENVKPTMLTKEFAAVEDGAISAAQIQRDAMGNIVAGTDTTAITATYATYCLSTRPDIQEALIREVSTLPAGFQDEDLRQLKMLNGVINETLRLHGAVGQGLPRLVPLGGATLCGYYVPESVTVGVQAYSVHHDDRLWPNANEFRPDRWFEPKHDMYAFLPFGGGSHVCIGSHFAQLELRHALANFYRTFDVGVKPAEVNGFGEDDMLQMSFFLTPRSQGKEVLVATSQANILVLFRFEAGSGKVDIRVGGKQDGASAHALLGEEVLPL